jgi:hypothetical protein
MLPASADLDPDLADDDDDDVIKQKQGGREEEREKGTKRRAQSYVRNIHTRPRTSVLQAIDIEVYFPQLYAAIMELEPTFVISHPDGLWLQPKFYEGLKRGSLHYVNTWIKENPAETSSISHHGMLVLECLAKYKRFTTYDELKRYLEKKGMGAELFLSPDRLDAYQSHSSSKNVGEEDEQRRMQQEEREKETQKIRTARGLAFDEELVETTAHFVCRCRANNKQARAWKRGDDAFAVCKVCELSILL